MELNCSTCQTRLRIDNEHTCQLSRCPSCQTLFEVTGDGPPQIRRLLLETSEDDVAAWRLWIPDGVTFGPVLPAQLNDWVMQGRVSADCELSQDSADSWTRANHVFPFLATLRTSAVPESETRPVEVDEHSRFAPHSAVDGAESVKPHRGGLVLAIGMLSWLTQCVGFGVVAWAMGLHDLREMSDSRRDAGGRTATRIGMIFGAIHCIVLVVVVGLAFILSMLPALARLNW